MDSNQIRKKFIGFFQSKNHQDIGSVSLPAENDPSLLFVNSGMFPLVPYLSGKKHPLGKRLVNCQRSFRADDIEEIGDQRHTTFFEMLGNWSLGGYFKKEQLNWWYEFLIEVLKLDPKRLYQTVFNGDKNAAKDQESIDILTGIYGKYKIKAKVGPALTDGSQSGPETEIDFGCYRIFPYVSKNWWQRGDRVGELGGPDSETFYDTGRKHNPKFGKYCHLNCECGRFIEIGNSVFMQYKKIASGWEELPQKNVDFGAGLERLTMAVNGMDNIFKTDLFIDYLQYLEKKANKKYQESQSAFEIISDHSRAAVFLLADGCLPANKDQGYFVRRLIRRSLINLRKIGLEFNALTELADLIINKMSTAYSHLEKNKVLIKEQIKSESLKFNSALKCGLKYFEKIKPENNRYCAEEIFDLLSTYGLPLEIIKELALEKGCQVDEKGLRKKIEEHRSVSKKGEKTKFKSGLADSAEQTIKLHTATHLLHEALRRVLGPHVEQKGSNITCQRLRFDFSHPEKLTSDQIKQVEKTVNEEIKKKQKIYCEITDIKTARQSGAIGLFNAKYADKISVYSIGAPLNQKNKFFSREICAGPHIKNTAELGRFKIVKEEASSAGIRRIKAILIG